MNQRQFQERESRYYEFSSKISFLELIQKEFKEPHFDLDDYREEINILEESKTWTINDLSKLLYNRPKALIVFEEIFQLLRFTNVQLIHFFFDISRLNTTNLNAVYEYMVLNLENDEGLRKTFFRTFKDEQDFDNLIANISEYKLPYIIAHFKLAVTNYIKRISRDYRAAFDRMSKKEFIDISYRISNYLLKNFNLNSYLGGVNIKQFLKNKRRPIDSKYLHGEYLKKKTVEVLDSKGFKCIDEELDGRNIKTLNEESGKELSKLYSKNDHLFCTERYVEDVIKPKDGKLKRFDLIIFKNYKPKHLFEMNFYSTSGTKIGINQNEYIDLKNFIKTKKEGYEFYWITDGNYWLTSGGKERYINLLDYFSEIHNLNTFKRLMQNL